MADALRKEPDVHVNLVNGSPGELTVLVDGKEVAGKEDSLPEINEVVAAVRRSGTPAGAPG